LDRIVHNGHRNQLKGDSLRRQPAKGKPEPTISPPRA
jgi:hypothetical protein